MIEIGIYSLFVSWIGIAMSDMNWWWGRVMTLIETPYLAPVKRIYWIIVSISVLVTHLDHYQRGNDVQLIWFYIKSKNNWKKAKNFESNQEVILNSRDPSILVNQNSTIILYMMLLLIWISYHFVFFSPSEWF